MTLNSEKLPPNLSEYDLEAASLVTPDCRGMYFGGMCQIYVTDTGAVLLERYASDEIKRRYLRQMLSQDLGEVLKGAQYMTERAGGSDLAYTSLVARRDGDFWRLYGDKWFCS